MGVSFLLKRRHERGFLPIQFAHNQKLVATGISGSIKQYAAARKETVRGNRSPLLLYRAENIPSPSPKINSEGLDTSKILYGVFTNVWEEFLWILRITEGSWDSLGFLRIPADSKGLLRILWSQDHGNFRDSVGVCQNPWRFSRILRYSSKSVRRFWSVEPLDQ